MHDDDDINDDNGDEDDDDNNEDDDYYDDHLVPVHAGRTSHTIRVPRLPARGAL